MAQIDPRQQWRLLLLCAEALGYASSESSNPSKLVERAYKIITIVEKLPTRVRPERMAIATARYELGKGLLKIGNTTEAIRAFEGVLEEFRWWGNVFMEKITLRWLAVANAIIGKKRVALSFYRQSLRGLSRSHYLFSAIETVIYLLPILNTKMGMAVFWPVRRSRNLHRRAYGYITWKFGYTRRVAASINRLLQE